MSHGADTALHLFRIRNATERGRYHVTVFERGNELRALSGILAKPVQQLGKSPFGGVDAAAPLDCFKTFTVCYFGNLRGFAFRAVITPQIIFAKRLQILPDRND